MKTQINLLHSEFTPKFELVCANNFIAVIIASIILCSGAFGITGYQLRVQEQEVTALQNEIKREQSSVQELTTALTDRAANPQLQNKFASFTEQTKIRVSLLNHIRNLSALKQRSFSVLFDSLSQSNSTELWLTEFLVTPDELNLAGIIAQPRALPMWISELSQTDFFKGQQFNVASVEREQDSLVFKLNSMNKEIGPNIAQVGVNNEG